MRLSPKFLTVLSTITLLSSFTILDKKEISKPTYEKPFVIVGQMPHFPGGKLAMQRYIAQNLTYPFDALKNNIQGKVNVEFVVSWHVMWIELFVSSLQYLVNETRWPFLSCS